MILTLLNRFFRICSTYEHFRFEVEKFRKIFNLSGCPTYFSDKCIQLSLNKIYNPTPSVLTVAKKVICICLPLIGFHSPQIRTQIQKICSSTFSHIKIRTVFRPTKRLSHFFTFKDRIPKGLTSHVVYSFTCQCCNALYVGQTVRHLHTRVSDHLGISPLTGKKRTNPSPSVILPHLSETGHSASLNDFPSLSSCSSSSELLVKESLHIRQHNPSLNTNLSPTPLYPCSN